MQNRDELDEAHWIWAKFDELNDRHFHGRLERPQKILRCAFQSWAAAAVNKTTGGVRCSLIWLDGAALDRDAAAASDSLLHEMIHYELAGSADGDGDQAHGERFIQRADEIGRALGLAACAVPGFGVEQVAMVARNWPEVQREALKLKRDDE